MIEINPSYAQEIIHRLSRLLRYILNDANGKTVKLTQEIELVEKYIQLMEINQNQRVAITCDFIKMPDRDCRIAPLLFIPLVENAFKHGVSAYYNSKIIFKIKTENNTVIFSTQNNYYPGTVKYKGKSGNGIKNLKKRLELIYPGKHILSHQIVDDLFMASLTINLEE